MLTTLINESHSSSSSSEPETTTERRPRLLQKKAVRSNMSTLADMKKANAQEGFLAGDMDYLAENEYNRYDSNSKRIGHAVIKHDEHGDLVAQQYDLPAGTLNKSPILTRLTDIEAIVRHGDMHYQAKGFDGRKYYSRRSILAKINNTDDIEIACFSEEEDPDFEPEWGNNRAPVMFREDANLSPLPKRIKGGHKMMVDPEAVRYRDANHDRGIDQNTVMGMAEQKEADQITDVSDKPVQAVKAVKPSKSATKVYQDFFKAMEQQLTPEISEILQRAFKAELHSAPENQYRPEWLHTYAFSLTPANEESQLADKLGAAGKWVNTEMMILERMAKWFAINQANIQISIISAFEMVRDSDIVGSVHYELGLELLNRSIQFILDVEAFRENPLFRKASDLAQATGIAYAILHEHQSTPIEKITPGRAEEDVVVRTEPAPDSYVSIEETILKLLDSKKADADYALVTASKKLKTEEDLSRWRLGNRFFAPPANMPPGISTATIVDFETTGRSPFKHEIIEIGMVSFSFKTTEEVWDVIGHYHALNDPNSPIPLAITNLTKIDDAMVAGKKIDWDLVLQFLQRSDFIICHNSKFDRKFFELRSPEDVSAMVRTKRFGCTLKDIDWDKRGYESRKLAFLNKKMGFPFVGHRAINDCWATLNLLIQDATALGELVINIKRETMIGVINGPFDKKDLLKEWDYHWSTGINTRLPKGWWVCVPNEYVEVEIAWLQQEILAPEKGKKVKGYIEEHDAAIDRYAPRMLG